MTTYFDEKDREISDILSACEDDAAAFLEAVGNIERYVAMDVSLCCGDREFPEDVREQAMTIIAAKGVFKTETHKPTDYALESVEVGGTSEMLGDLHSLFHQLAGRGIECRYGKLCDSPWVILKSRDTWETEQFGSGVLSSRLALNGSAGIKAND